MAERGASVLAGKRVLVTRPLRSDSKLEKILRAAGAEAVLLPLIRIEPLPDAAKLDALDSLDHYDWLIFTSQNAVEMVAGWLAERRSGEMIPSSLQIAAVGAATAEAAREASFHVTHASHGGPAADLISEIANKLKGKRVLLPRSDRAAPQLVELIRKTGADVTDVVAYRTVLVDPSVEDVGEVDAALFFSPSAVQAFRASRGSGVLSKIENCTALGAIGPVTEGAMRSAGLRCDFVAERPGSEEFVAALAAFLEEKKRRTITGVGYR